MRNQALESRRKSAKNIPSLPRFCAVKASDWMHGQSLNLLHTVSTDCCTAVVQCKLEKGVLWGREDSWSCVSGGFVVQPHFPPAIFLTLANHIASLCLRFSSHVNQEPSSPSEELGELIKTYSGMRLMPIVQGIVKTLSGVQFSHPSRRWMTANWYRCREELLGEATEKITDGRMVFLRRREEKSCSCMAQQEKKAEMDRLLSINRLRKGRGV